MNRRDGQEAIPPGSASTAVPGSPTLRDVAEAAGVHTATASRALNETTRALVSAETARKVLRAAEQLAYVPNPIARGLRTSHSRAIGVVLPDLTNPLFPPIARSIQDVLTESGYIGFIVNTDNDPGIERAQIASLRAWHVEGLIIATALLDHPLLEQLHLQGVRMVLVNRRTAAVELPAVTPDDASGVDMSVHHLAALGHRRILHLAGPQTTSTGLVRARAFTQAVRELQLDADPELVIPCDHWSEAEGVRALKLALDRGLGFSAVVAGNDLLALGCYEVFAERGIRCPDDVSVVGFNDMPYVDKLMPPLTTVNVPQHQIGAEACRMLLESIDRSERRTRSVLLPVSLVIRGSTAPPSAVSGKRA